jgi:DNA recombination protein RmuC
MTDSTLMIALTITALATIGALAAIVALHRAKRHGGDDEQSTPSPDLTRRLDEMQTVLAGRDGALGAQVAQLDARLAALQSVVTGREAALEEQVRGIGTQMQGLSSLFANDRVRGGWAEIGMRRIFEQGGLVEGRDYTCQVQGHGVKPDAIVHLPGGRNIVVDAKFPVARFQEAMAESRPDRRRSLLAEQGKELERLGKELTSRGYAGLASGGYVVMYLGSQAVYEAAAEAHPELIDRLMASRVIVAGPTALYALLLTVASVLTEFKAVQEADRILEEARELHHRLTTFVGHLHGVGTALGAAVRSFNAAAGSWGSRVAPHLARMSEATGRDRIETPAPVDEMIRETSDPGLQMAG